MKQKIVILLTAINLGIFLISCGPSFSEQAAAREARENATRDSTLAASLQKESDSKLIKFVEGTYDHVANVEIFVVGGDTLVCLSTGAGQLHVIQKTK